MHKKNPVDNPKGFLLFCALEGSRTPNLLIRSQVLYPVKLQARSELDCKDMNQSVISKNKFIKIGDLVHPKANLLKITQKNLLQPLPLSVAYHYTTKL